MKGFVTVILFFLFALAFAGTEYVAAVPAASMTVCTAERMYRFSSMETTQFIKILLRKMAARMASLASCHTHVYASSYSLPWDSACEHYIFGMRRILI